MKLIINISDEVKASIDRVGLLRIPDEQMTEIDVEIQNGKPLNSLCREINNQIHMCEEFKDLPTYSNAIWAFNKCLQLLDEYR